MQILEVIQEQTELLLRKRQDGRQLQRQMPIIEEVKRMDLPDLGNTDWCADIVDKGNLYRITYSANESQKYFSKETFYNMLSTFKFIN